MRFFWLLIFTLFLNLANAETLRHTSFDDRPICEENQGIWREFGNSCVNNCLAKFDKYEICAKTLTFGCDCGPTRCWYENKCITIASYKKIFAKKSEEDERNLEAKRREREERIKNDPNYNYYIHNIYPKPQNPQNQQNSGNQTAQNQQQGQNKGQIVQQNIRQMPSAQPVAVLPPQNVMPQQIPPFYLQQQKERAQNNEAGEPPLPEIPLPR